MKIKYLGTAAAEGIPGVFCQCDVCRRARTVGGKEIRTRSQALIDGKILIDLPPDTYLHTLMHNLELAPIRDLLVTHAHSDHSYMTELHMRRGLFAHMKEESTLTVHGSHPVGLKMADVLLSENPDEPRVKFHEIKAFEPFAIDDYTVIPFPARHDPLSAPYCYIIQHEGKSILYGHDTGYYFDEVWQYLAEKKIHLDLVSMDCTEACHEIKYDAHGSLGRDMAIRDHLLEIGAADETTVFCLNHFSHNGKNVLYEEFQPIAAAEGFEVSYDGMELEV